MPRYPEGPDPAWDIYVRQDDGRRRVTARCFQRPNAQALALREARKVFGDRGEIYPRIHNLAERAGGCFGYLYLDELARLGIPVDSWIEQQPRFQAEADAGISSLEPEEADQAEELPPELPE